MKDGWHMDDHASEDVREARAPIASLISKSEKAQQKVAPGTWQHTMLRDNVAALRIASELMNDDGKAERDLARDDLRDAVRAIDSMIDRTEKAGVKFAPGTSQHTLQRNRLKALRIAEAFVKAALERAD